MKKIYITGHKNPDTDAVCSAIAYANYLNKKGKKAIACRTGKINPETKFVLDYFKIKTPLLLSSAKNKKIVLVDHNEKTQAPNDIEKAEIIEVIDHHKVSFKSKSPIFFQTEPLGATATIIAKKYWQNKVTFSKKISGLLLSAILSDTVVFRSPTTTSEDIKVAKILAKIAKIKNIEEFGLEIKKAKSSLKGLKAKDIIFTDYKDFKIGKFRFGIGQVELCGLEEINEKRQEIMTELERSAKSKKYDLLLLVATDIIKMGSLFLFWEKENYIEKVFSKKQKDNMIYLKGVMSRKKQVVPPLTELFSKG